MRFSLSLAVLAAVGVYAFPQDLQPISQISDGQIQAPPATEVVPSSPLYTATVTEGVTVSESGGVVVPTEVITPTSELYTTTVTGSSVIVIPSSSVHGNTTIVVPTGPKTSHSVPSESPSGTSGPSPSASPPPSAAVANAFSFSGLVLAVLGAVLI